jgi:MinD-like ATPase involved in chromosome partitioning or flagellar assembly
MSSYKVLMYSFKGGAGRTVTTANVAYIMAKEMGRRVLCVDLDTESAGASVMFEVKKAVDNEDVWTLQDVLRGKFEPRTRENGATRGGPKTIVLGLGDFATALWPKLHVRIWPNSETAAGSPGYLDFLPARTIATSTSEVRASSYQAQQCFTTLLRKVDGLENPPEFILYDSAAGQQDTASLGMTNSNMLAVFVRWSRQFVYGTIDFLSDYITMEAEKSGRLDKVFLVPTAVPRVQPEGDLAARLKDRQEDVAFTVRSINEKARNSSLIKVLDPIPECAALKWDDQVFLMKEPASAEDDVKGVMAAYRSLAGKIVEQSEIHRARVGRTRPAASGRQ